MSAGRHSKRGNRSGFIATAAAVVFALTGISLIGVAIASQRRAPEVPFENGGSATTSGTPGASGAWLRPAASDVLPSVIGPTLVDSKPTGLSIPSIGVDSDVNHLGLAADGSLETPAPGPLYNEAAWYRYSPTPGSLGPAILLGHVDSAAEGPSVFYRLGELEPGDRISVTRADGSIAVFMVESVRRYAKDNFPTELVYSDIDHAGLRIVTCGGAFDTSTGHYLDNVVVFASLVGARQATVGVPAPG